MGRETRSGERGVLLFMAAGLALALVVGVLVWNASAPERGVTAGFTSTPEASNTAVTPTRTVRTTAPAATTTEGSPTGSSAAERSAAQVQLAGGADAEGAPGLSTPNPNYRMEADPYAPPHAVTRAPNAPSAPTAVYRPSNVRPPSQEMSAPARESAAAPGTSRVPTATTTPLTVDMPAERPAQQPGAETATAPTSAAEPVVDGGAVPEAPVTDASEAVRRMDLKSTDQGPQDAVPTPEDAGADVDAGEVAPTPESAPAPAGE